MFSFILRLGFLTDGRDGSWNLNLLVSLALCCFFARCSAVLFGLFVVLCLFACGFDVLLWRCWWTGLIINSFCFLWVWLVALICAFYFLLVVFLYTSMLSVFFCDCVLHVCLFFLCEFVFLLFLFFGQLSVGSFFPYCGVLFVSFSFGSYSLLFCFFLGGALPVCFFRCWALFCAYAFLTDSRYVSWFLNLLVSLALCCCFVIYSFCLFFCGAVFVCLWFRCASLALLVDRVDH